MSTPPTRAHGFRCFSGNALRESLLLGATHIPRAAVCFKGTGEVYRAFPGWECQLVRERNNKSTQRGDVLQCGDFPQWKLPLIIQRGFTPALLKHRPHTITTRQKCEELREAVRHGIPKISVMGLKTIPIPLWHLLFP